MTKLFLNKINYICIYLQDKNNKNKTNKTVKQKIQKISLENYSKIQKPTHNTDNKMYIEKLYQKTKKYIKNHMRAGDPFLLKQNICEKFINKTKINYIESLAKYKLMKFK